MKRLKFSSELVPLVRSGEKTTTWRCFDEKGIKTGDELSLCNGEGVEFAVADATAVKEVAFRDLTSEDRSGHDSYATDEEMYVAFTQFYGCPIGPETLVKIIHFTLRV
ncbi:MAG: ASCH domain-containing protein [Candidatus Uhrbacteria bacterium]